MEKIITFLLPSLLIASSYGATITKVNKNTVILQYQEDENPKKEIEFSVIDAAQVETGKIVLKKIDRKKQKAQGEIISGNVIVGQSVKIDTANDTSDGDDDNKTSTEIYRGKGGISGLFKKIRWSGAGSLNTSNIKVKVSSTTSSATGMGYGAFLLGDLRIPWNINLNGHAGLKMLNATGKMGDENANLIITYLSLGGLTQYLIPIGKNQLSFGLGASYLIPMSKSSKKLLDVKNISSTNTYDLAVGYNIKLKKNRWLPIVLEYGMFPDSKSSDESVTANWIHLRIGYTF